MREMKFFVIIVLFFATVFTIITLNPLGMGTAIVGKIEELLFSFIESPYLTIAIMTAGIAIMIGAVFR